MKTQNTWFTFSQLLKTNPSSDPRILIALDHIKYQALHPDRGSKFEKKSQKYQWLLRKMSPRVLAWVFRFQGYDGLVLFQGDAMVGHLFYQKGKNYWGMFSIFVVERYRNFGVATALLRRFLEVAFDFKECNEVRLGDGGNKVVDHLWRKACLNGALDIPHLLVPGKTHGSLVRCGEGRCRK
jgi:hypothetical protein